MPLGRKLGERVHPAAGHDEEDGCGLMVKERFDSTVSQS